MVNEIQTNEDFNHLKESAPLALVYFSTDACNVCTVLKPKVFELIKTEFPKLNSGYLSIGKLPEIAAQNQVFVSPTIIVFYEGNEFFRKSRNFGLEELHRAIERPYNYLYRQ